MSVFCRHQRNKLKLDNLSLSTSPDRMMNNLPRPLRHQHSTDNMHGSGNNVFNIPYVKVEQRKTCSEENMIKTHSSSKSSSYYIIRPEEFRVTHALMSIASSPSLGRGR